MDTAKYVHLLRPLRVLADNWDVNIANELSEFVDEVERFTQLHHTQHLDLISSSTQDSAQDSTQNLTTDQLQQELGLNFAQAALLIQNSASIYSKKVQYLYNLTQEAHDYLFHARTGAAGESGKSSSSSNSQQAAASALLLDPNSFECLDKVMMERDFTLNESRDQVEDTNNQPGSNFTTLSRFTCWNRRDPGTIDQVELFGTNGESIGYRHEFEMNEAILDENGVLMCSIAVPLHNDDNPVVHEEEQVMMMMNNSRLSAVDIGAAAMMDDHPLDFGFDQPEDSFHNQQMSDGHEDMPEQLAEPTGPNEHEPSSHVAQDKDSMDFWTLADPHSNTNKSLDKPFKKGGFSRGFKVIEKIIESKSGRKKLTTTVRDFLEEDRPAKPLPRDPLRRIAHPEFHYIYLKEKERREKFMTGKTTGVAKSDLDFVNVAPAARKVTEFVEIPVEDLIAPEGQNDDDEQPFVPFNMDDIPEDFDDEPAPLPPMMDLGEDHQTSLEHSNATADHRPFSDLPPLGTDINSFEDLCKLRIENYLQEASQFEHQVESMLAKRVRSWESRLHPLLEEQETRKPYDIHDYEMVVLDKFKQSLPEQGESRLVSFEKLADDVPVYDVSRYFLALLHLANEGQVEIGDDSERGMVLLAPERQQIR